MKLKWLSRSLFLLGLALEAAAECHGNVLLSDNFDSNTFNSSKWAINTSLFDIYGTPKVVEQNQRIEITGRGYLNTVTNYDPAALGGLQINGTWTFLSVGPGDSPKIVTRSSGTPSSYYVASGEVTSGVTFGIGVPGAPVLFYIAGWGSANVTGQTVVSNTLALAQGDTVSFQVTDDGTNLSFAMAKVGNPAMAAYATAVCTNRLPVNQVSFYNREYNANQLALDNVVIQTLNTRVLTNIVLSPAASTIAAGSNLQ
ncbi:MAG TPA: hypothetical protein VNZ22_16185, partial [Bacillota bacterium]|nr:hypothetical protein [Bacillota bacterium]